MSEANGLMNKIVSLCKRRGFIFQSSEIYGGLKSAYDFGPVGVELKRNIANCWWEQMVHSRDDVVGFDASIVMHPKVWEASGHVQGFFDPLVDCLNCKQRFRADKAPQQPVGETVSYVKGGARKRTKSRERSEKGEKLQGQVADCGYVCPHCGAPTLSAERRFNLMFQSNLGPIDPQAELLHDIMHDETLTLAEVRARLQKLDRSSTIYLRPETAQALFVQFVNVMQTTGQKIPFGIAQIGKSFRNEIVTEHFIFRSCEFEQMELEYFIAPDSWQEQLEFWKTQRLNWYLALANSEQSFRLRQHERDELAHYAQDCYDVEFLFPWGWDELEGIASRGDYDLHSHQKATGAKLSYFDPHKVNAETGKQGVRYTPYVIEPSAGLTRCVLALLLDAYREDKGVDQQGREKVRVFLQLHPCLAPYKAAVLPLIKNDAQQVELAQRITRELKKHQLHICYDDNQSIGKRYARHDEIGTPFCITVDAQSLADETVTLRERDTTNQQRLARTALADKITAALVLSV